MARRDVTQTSGNPTARVGTVRPLALLTSNIFGLLLLIALLCLFYSNYATGFTSKFNLYTMGRVMAIDIVIGFAMMVVLVTGGLNLAVGAIGVAAAMFGGWTMESLGIHWSAAVVLTLGFGALLGAVNGYATVRSGVHSFIITLATMSIYFGAMIVLTDAEAFRALPKSFTQIGKLRYFGFISALLFIALATALALFVLFNYTALGRKIKAAGANPVAAELSGVSVGNMFIFCHALSGLLAALAGLMLTARNGAALPSMAGHVGQDWLLPSFLAPVLGGTLLTGGTISVVGTALGAILVSVITTGLLLMKFADFWLNLFLGLILLAAVLLDRLRSVYAERRTSTQVD